MTGGFIPDDILNDILLRLPTGASIVRLRCVCKSWNRLLSDPRFIHDILFSPDVNFAGNDETAQVLIAGGDEYGGCSTHYVYSLLHYHNLKTITPIDKDPDLPCVPVKLRSLGLRSSIVGCCDGIVCIAEKNILYYTASDIILWNPATSETRVLPRSPFSGHRKGPEGRLFVELVGFGFDSETNDYKIFRSIDAPSYEGPKSWSLVEVYSLKNDAWRIVNGEYSPLKNDSWRRLDGQFKPSKLNPVCHPYWYRGEKLYWWKSDREGTQLWSWDMGKEEFDSITFPNPNPTHVPMEYWVGRSFTVLKDSIVGMFSESCRGRYFKNCSFEIRVLLKFDRDVAWTLLYSISIPKKVRWCHGFLGIWKGGMYFMAYHGKVLFTFDPETGPVGNLGILHKFAPQIVAFVPSKVSFL